MVNLQRDVMIFYWTDVNS